MISVVTFGLLAVAAARPTTTAVSSPATAGADVGFKFPLPNGFPDPDAASLAIIEQNAQGTLPNSPPPASVHAESATSLGLIAFNEIFEVAFFHEVVHNITTNAKGYCNIPDRAEVLNALHAVVAQEQLHALDANTAFKKFTGDIIEPCRYSFPVDTFDAAVALASTFTDLVLGVLPAIQTTFGENDDSALIGLVGAVIGQEGEQNGFYRHLLKKTPSALSFLTAGSQSFAFSAILQNFVVPGSCPSLSLLESRGLKHFGLLKAVSTNFAREDVIAEFSITANTETDKTLLEQVSVRNSVAALTYINQQNVPVSVPMAITGTDGNGTYKFKAPFPGKKHDLGGLTIAAVTNSSGPFASADAVAAATLFGPALIEV